MDSSPRLGLPYLLPNQSQKHVTLKEALRRLDVLCQLAIDSRLVSAEPAKAENGDVYIMTGQPSGPDWSALSPGSLVARVDGAWLPVPVTDGTRGWLLDEGRAIVWLEGFVDRHGRSIP